MNYRSVADLNEDIKRWVPQLPKDVDLVVGIPRSGLLAANLTALQLNVPLTDLDGFLTGRVLSTGERFEDDPESTPRRVLVLDDSVLSGSSMAEARQRVADTDLPMETEVVFGAVYISPRGKRLVDTYADVVSPPRVFEWNLMHHPTVVPKSCFDLDGVLCRDPTPEENDDGPRYREFISTVDPRVVPSTRIGWIVTARLEKYREPTEAWLDRHGFEYDELIMLDLPSAKERRRRASHAQYKARMYHETGAELFVESDHSQAVEIARQTDGPVYDVERNQMIRQGRVTSIRRESQRRLREFRTDPAGFLRQIAGSVAIRLGLLSP